MLAQYPRERGVDVVAGIPILEKHGEGILRLVGVGCCKGRHDLRGYDGGGLGEQVRQGLALRVAAGDEGVVSDVDGWGAEEVGGWAGRGA